jgi:hypothetical protein
MTTLRNPPRWLRILLYVLAVVAACATFLAVPNPARGQTAQSVPPLQSIIDSTGAKWTLGTTVYDNTRGQPEYAVQRNGAYTGYGILIYYLDGKVYHLNAPGTWYRWNGSYWDVVSDPRPAEQPPAAPAYPPCEPSDVPGGTGTEARVRIGVANGAPAGAIAWSCLVGGEWKPVAFWGSGSSMTADIAERIRRLVFGTKAERTAAWSQYVTTSTIDPAVKPLVDAAVAAITIPTTPPPPPPPPAEKWQVTKATSNAKPAGTRPVYAWDAATKTRGKEVDRVREFEPCDPAIGQKEGSTHWYGVTGTDKGAKGVAACELVK